MAIYEVFNFLEVHVDPDNYQNEDRMMEFIIQKLVLGKQYQDY